MALNIVTEALVVVPIGVATEISPANPNRIGFTFECQSLGVDWWVRLLAAAAEDTGFHGIGRQVFDMNEALPLGPETTDTAAQHVGAISIFVKGTEANARFWVVEVE